MPRSAVVLVDGVWTQLGSTGKMIVTVDVVGDKYLRFNEAASDVAASQFSKDECYQNRQWEQTSDAEDTWVKAGGGGWTVIVDQE